MTFHEWFHQVLSMGLYQPNCTRYCSKLGKYPEAINNLKTAIEADRGYWSKTLSIEDLEDFKPMSSQLKELAELMTQEMDKKADLEFERTNGLIDKFRSVDKPYSEVNFDSAKEKLNEGITLKTEGTYPSCKDAVYKALVAQKIAVDSAALHLSNQESTQIENKSRIKDLIYNTRYILPKGLKSDPNGGVPGVSLFIRRNLKSMVKWLGIPWLLYILWLLNDIGWIFSPDFRGSVSLLELLLELLFHPSYYVSDGYINTGLMIFALTLTYIIYIIKNTYKVRKYHCLISGLKKRLDGVESELNKITQIRALIKSEKLNLNLDDVDLGPMEFETYLRKTYG